MSRRKTLTARMAQAYRNAAPSPRELAFPHRWKSGDLIRSGGAHNWPFPQGGHSRSILSLVADRNRQRRYPAQAPALDLDAMNREQLRALAKERGMKGYGHMKTAALREALS